MFSSLPSASKIYVSSCRPKQKSCSAKKKRKKVIATNCTPTNVEEEVTLVATSSFPELSLSESSLHELNSKIDLNHESENGYSNDISDSEKNFVAGNVESNIYIEKSNSSHLPEIVCLENGFNKVSNQENHSDNQTEIILDTLSNNESKTCTLPNTSLNENSDFSDILSSDSLTESTVKSALKISKPAELIVTESDVIDSKSVTDFSVIEMNNKISQTTFDDNIEAPCDANNCTLSEFSLDRNDSNVTEVNKILTSVVDANNKREDSLDNLSVKSDCCTSSNIFDIHVDNSEPSSIDENEVGHNESSLVPGKKIETIHIETALPNKSELLNENNYQSDSELEKNSGENSTFKISDPESFKNNSEKFDNSCSLTNLQKIKSEDTLQRSASLPENFCEIKNSALEVCDTEISKTIKTVITSESFPPHIEKVKATSDKATFTLEQSIYTYDKCTFTTDLPNDSPQLIYKCGCQNKIEEFKKEENLSRRRLSSSSFKDTTMLLMKVLPPVCMAQARARSYVFGSIGSNGSLLGNEELSRLFPDNKITIFVGTWNMNGHNPPECIDDFLLPLDVSSLPDMYAVGVQESMQSRSEWEILLQTTLGPSHVLFTSASLGVLHLAIFIRRDLIWFCSEPEEASIATRPGSMIKTKGAVAICFMFFGTSFLFVNSHLTAHEQKLKERVTDYEKICAALDLPKHIPLKSYLRSKDVTSRFDCVFWCGDLNFRVVQDRPAVLSFVEEKIKKCEDTPNVLMQHDQLSQAMTNGTAFHGFNEGVINFIPTYKFDVGTSSFDSIKHRVPSYTDRILYRSRDKSSIVCLHYDTVSEIFTSDHKPVFSVFNVTLKPGRDNIPLAAGLFKRDIYLEAIKRRARQLEVRNQKQSTVCSIM